MLERLLYDWEITKNALLRLLHKDRPYTPKTGTTQTDRDTLAKAQAKRDRRAKR
jgi:hypothetical protein